MEDLLIAILQGMIEFLFEVVGYIPFDWPFADRWPSRLIERCAVWFVVGCGLAFISVLFFKRTWIVWPVLRITNLIVAPVVSGLISQALARRRSRKNPEIVPRNHFWQAFWFTLGLVTVRFAYSVRH